MKFKYEELLEKNGKSVSDFSSDIQSAISYLVDAKRAYLLVEKNGRKLTKDKIERMNAIDKLVCKEIEAEIAGKGSDPKAKEAELEAKRLAEQAVRDAEAAKAKADAEEAERKKKADEGNQNTEKGDAVDAEFEVLNKAGKTTLTLSELKSTAPTAYEIIFEAYKEGEENGIETGKFSLIETEKETFTLTKK